MQVQCSHTAFVDQITGGFKAHNGPYMSRPHADFSMQHDVNNKQGSRQGRKTHLIFDAN